MYKGVARRRRTDARQQLQYSEPGDSVSRVLDPPQYAKHVFDVRRLKELQPAVFDERDATAPELDFELVAVVAGAEQHRLPLQVDAFFAVLQHTLDDVLGLCRFIGGNDQLRPLAGWFVREELFAKAFSRLRDHGVTCLQYRFCRAVVLLERDDLR